jgi:hypothetical protein
VLACYTQFNWLRKGQHYYGVDPKTKHVQFSNHENMSGSGMVQIWNGIWNPNKWSWTFEIRTSKILNGGTIGTTIWNPNKYTIQIPNKQPFGIQMNLDFRRSVFGSPLYIVFAVPPLHMLITGFFLLFISSQTSSTCLLSQLFISCLLENLSQLILVGQTGPSFLLEYGYGRFSMQITDKELRK